MKGITAVSGNTEYKIDFTDESFNSGQINDEEFALDWIKEGERSFHLIYNNRSINVELISFDKEEKKMKLELNGNQYDIQLKDHFDQLLSSMGLEDLASAGVTDLKAPMPGLVLNVEVESGSEVKKGDALLVLEAMKMENVLKSPVDGVIKEIAVNQGDSVEKNQTLINFES